MATEAPEQGAARDSYLGRGIYDIAKAACLLHSTHLRIENWTRTGARKPPILTPELEGLFSFWDLMSLRVMAKLIDKGVKRDHIITGAEHLAQALGTNRPFAHKSLAAAGTGFFTSIYQTVGWEDIRQGGQLVFQEVVSPLLEPITFDDSDMAAIWRPHLHVWINPEVQAGEPCIDGTRVPTGLIAALISTDDDIAEVTDDYRLSEEQVRAALDFEYSLAA